MARIYESGENFIYEVDDFLIKLDQETFIGCQHRHSSFALMDWVGVLDERDGQHYSHWRYDQPQDSFNEMMTLVHQIGFYMLVTTPHQELETMFNLTHQMSDSDFDHLLEGPDGEE